MAIKKYFDRLRRIDYLVHTKATGNTTSLAKKLRLSRSSTLQCLKEMKESGFPIKYSAKRQSYYYCEDGRMVTRLFEKSDPNG